MEQMPVGLPSPKTLLSNGNEIELRPANESMEPIRVAADEVEVVGVVMGLLRNYRQKSRKPY
jgi:repressor LexA